MVKAAFRHSAVRGFTFTELAIVLAIMGVIFGSIWVAAATVYAGNHAKQAREEILTIINNWRGLYGNRPVDIVGAAGTDITQLTVNYGLAPSNMIPNGGAGACVVGVAWVVGVACYLDGPWTDSQVNVQAFRANNAIAVVYSNVSQTVCQQFANTLTSTTGLMQTTINGTVTQYPPLGASLPLLPSQINAQCNAAGNGNSILAMFSMN